MYCMYVLVHTMTKFKALLTLWGQNITIKLRQNLCRILKRILYLSFSSLLSKYLCIWTICYFICTIRPLIRNPKYSRLIEWGGLLEYHKAKLGQRELWTLYIHVRLLWHGRTTCNKLIISYLNKTHTFSAAPSCHRGSIGGLGQIWHNVIGRELKWAN